MKLRLKSIISSIIFISVIIVLNSVIAQENVKYLGITTLKNLNEPNMGYAIGVPNQGGRKIWNIVEYPSSQSTQTKNIDAFCVKAGVGFSDTKKRQEYDKSYNMDTQYEEIANQNEILNQLVEGGYYKEVLSLLDLTYYPGEDDVSVKDKLLSNAIPNYDEFEYKLTDNDIVAVEQAAIWYFTNADESIYDQYGKNGWLNYTLNGDSYSNLSKYEYSSLNPSESEGYQRNIQAEQLYNYLIDRAKQDAKTYKYSENGNVIEYVEHDVLVEEKDGKTIVGPFEFKKLNNRNFTLCVGVTDSDVDLDYTLLDSQKNAVEDNDIYDVVGQQFYIQIEDNTFKNINILFYYTYSNVEKTLWASSTNQQAQPIVILTKENSDGYNEYNYENKGQYDLSLRKYITKVNGQDVQTSRIPDVDTTPLIDGTSTTANYYGPKNPIDVKRGDVVTYNISIYNEAQKEGRAVTITDQLPSGLEFVEIVGNSSYRVKNYDTENNVVIFERINETNLEPFQNGDSLSSETLSYTAKVSAKSSCGVKTNVAWISEEYNAADNLTIINQEYPQNKNADRDSTPDVHPDVNKDNMTDYKGASSNKAVEPADPHYYYKGQYDDDDFEKVRVIVDKLYNVKILKKDKSGNTLTGATFEINGNQYSVDQKGQISLSNIMLDSIEDIETYTITEIKAPDGYIGFKGTINAQLHFSKTQTCDVNINAQDTIIKVLDENGTELENYSNNVSVSIEENTIVFEIYNEPEVVSSKANIKIIKEDKQNAKVLADAEFEVNGKVAKTDENGVLQVGGNEILSQDQVDKYTIKETKAPEGYSGFDGSIEVELHYIKNGNGYLIDKTNTIVTLLDKNGNKIDESELVNYEISENNFILHIKNEPLPFDLALIKNVYAVNGKQVPDRLLSVDVSGLNLNGATQEPANTAIYKQNKTPYPIETGDIVTYRIRVYNEGYIDGYASQITEDIPKGLEFLWSEKEGEELDQDITFTEAEKEAIKFNQEMLWQYNMQDNTVSTTILSKDAETKAGENLIPAFGYNDGTKTENDLKYKEVYIMLRVIATDPGVIRNEACVTKDEDKDGNIVQDRDSSPDEWKKYEDDEDYDNIILQNFDLALRKFIMGVSRDEVFDENDYIKNKNGEFTRAPVVDTSKLNTIDADGKLITTAIYNGPKNPVEVTINDYVLYCLRIYNEGGVDGYAAEIQDHLPPYLEFVDNQFNKEYGWTLSDDGRVVTSTYLKDKLIAAAKYDENDHITLSYVDLPIMCRVKTSTQPGYINTNIAEIMKYEDSEHEDVIDRDSRPGDTIIPSDSDLPTYMDNVTGTYIPGQYDDDDFEKVICQIFDLSLKKWCTDVITIYNGKTTVQPTGFNPYDQPDKLAKVDIDKKAIGSIKVKFKFGIRVTNEGTIAGYAKEVKDYIPDGLAFNAEDNPNWTLESEKVAVTTQLADTLLQPGEYADVYITLDWINSNDNFGTKINCAEISEDWNSWGVPDIDSIPDNKVKEEDDYDCAPVVLGIKTGENKTNKNLIVGLISLTVLALGTSAIVKFVII